MKHFASILAACFLLAVTGACHSSKKAATENGTVVNIVSPEISLDEFREIICSKATGYGNWEYVKIPVTVRLRQPKEMSIGGTAWMRRDSSIVISLKYMGFEVGSMSLTNDSVTVIDKMHKSFMAERLDKFLGGMRFDVSNLQNMLLGRPFLLGKTSVTANDIKHADIEADDAGWLVVPSDQPSNAGYGFRFSPAAILYGVIMQAGQHEPVTVSYGGSTVSPEGTVVKEVSVTARAGKTPIEATLEWNLNKMRWNDPSQHRTVKPGKNYKRLDSSQIPRILKNI